MSPLSRLRELGQSAWCDYISRAMLNSGELERLVKEDGVTGVTSNPTIFEKAINGSSDYDQAIAAELNRQEPQTSSDIFFHLAIEDIRHAADVLRPCYEECGGRDGMVSLEVSPTLAHDSEATIIEARRLFQRVDRPNLMIKVPGTTAALPAIETLIAEGINVNVTLLFSLDRYKEVVEAYLLGLESRLRRGQEINNVASVASFFVSRVDTLIDQLLQDKMDSSDANQQQLLRSLQGSIAVANAKIAYQHYKEVFAFQRFAKLKAAGAQTQRLLWASTGTKNPHYSDVLYIDSLIGPDTVNTIPPATYQAFKDHGNAALTLEQGLEIAHKNIALLGKLGVNLASATAQLEQEGIALFAASFQALLKAIEAKGGAGARTEVRAG